MTWRSLAQWVFLAALLLYAAAVHHGVGAAPQGSAVGWYTPPRFMFDWDFLVPVLDDTRRAVIFLLLPGLFLVGLVFASGTSAIARALAFSALAAIVLFAFYGVAAPFVWGFFRWRGSAVMVGVALTLGFAASAPFLAASWLRLGWPLRLALYLPALFGVIALICNATGTDPTLPFAISPWPAIPVFGIEVGALFLAIEFLAVAAGALGVAVLAAGPGQAPGDREDPGPQRHGRAAGAGLVLLGLATPALLLELGAALETLPFSVGGGLLGGLSVVCALGITGISALGVRRQSRLPRVRLRARNLAVGASLVGIPLLAGQALAYSDYVRTRDRTAQELIDALQAHFEREEGYPDELTDLVASGDLEELTQPRIGFPFLYDAPFQYRNFGTSFILEFTAPRWVQCAYSPPWEDEDEEEGEGEVLEEAWSCPSAPPELW